MTADVLVDLGTGMAIIGVMIVLFVRAGSRIDNLDAKFESRLDKMDAKSDAMARDVVDVNISVARIEGYSQARNGFSPSSGDRPVRGRTSISLRPATARQDSRPTPTLLSFPRQNSSARSLALLIDGKSYRASSSASARL